MKKLGKFLIATTIFLMATAYFFSRQGKIADEAYGWNLILVNEDYYIPEDYEIELTTLDNGEQVDARIYPALQEMFDAAQAEGVYMFVADGYRTHKEQQELMDEKVEDYKRKVLIGFIAEWFAEKWVAVPGTSEHQLGIAVDINADISNSSSSEVYRWLAENAYKFGFIQRYPTDKTDITGISYEPWHYRYVGEEVAKEIFEKGICLEEYIEGLDS